MIRPFKRTYSHTLEMEDKFIHKNYTPLELTSFNTWRESTKGRGMVLVTAGRTGSGKSTLVKNLLGPGLSNPPVSKHSSSSVTKAVECHTNVVEGVNITIADVPGLAGEPGQDENKIIAQLHKKTNGKADMLLYCASMAPSSRIGEDDLKIVKLLTLVFTPQIWERAILVLTSADYVRERNSDCSTNPTVESKMEDYARKFNQILLSANVNSFTVIPVKPNKTLFDKRLAKEIAAVPAGEIPDKKTLAGIQWDSCVYLEVVKKCKFEAVPEILSIAEAEFLKKKKLLITGAGTVGVAAGVAAGAAAVGAVGAAAGVPFGAVGAVPGALIGGAVGGITGYFGTDIAFHRFLNSDQIKLLEIRKNVEQGKTTKQEDQKQK